MDLATNSPHLKDKLTGDFVKEFMGLSFEYTQDQFYIAPTKNCEKEILALALAVLSEFERVGNFHFDLREFDYFMRDNPYQQWMDENISSIINQLVNVFSELQRRAPAKFVGGVAFTKMNMVEKVSSVQALLDQAYPMVELVDVEDEVVVIALNADSSCESDQILTSIQNYLQERLDCDRINVIPEY